MSYITAAALVRSQAFQDQVQVAIVAEALIILAASPDPMADPTNLRLALAHRVLDDSSRDLFRIAWAVATNPSISDISTDGEVLFAVDAVWSALAGIDPT